VVQTVLLYRSNNTTGCYPIIYVTYIHTYTTVLPNKASHYQYHMQLDLYKTSSLTYFFNYVIEILTFFIFKTKNIWTQRVQPFKSPEQTSWKLSLVCDGQIHLISRAYAHHTQWKQLSSEQSPPKSFHSLYADTGMHDLVCGAWASQPCLLLCESHANNFILGATGKGIIKLRGARTRRFITALTTARHRSLSWDSRIQSTPPKPISLRSILIITTDNNFIFFSCDGLALFDREVCLCCCSPLSLLRRCFVIVH
jgi:hypothetical protein